MRIVFYALRITSEVRETVKAQLRQAAHRLFASEHAVALTGAGVSTPSGIPDFRSAGTGLWSFVDPMRVASIWAFREDPEAFYRWVRPLAKKVLTAQPNPAHLALAELEAAGHLRAIITQNIDLLHEKAGSRRVLEIHGHFRTLSCLACHTRQPSEAHWPRFLADGSLPRCPRCQAILKPDAILFGEVPSHDILREAQQEALRCDLMLVAGSSLEVIPAADLPSLARRRGATLIIVNDQPTPIDHRAEFVFHADVAKVLPRLAALCRQFRSRAASNAGVWEGTALS